MASAKALAAKLLETLARDADDLALCDQYLNGYQAGPYLPPNADDEYRLLAQRSISNLMPLMLTPAQMLYVDNFRPGRNIEDSGSESDELVPPEWQHFQDSRLDARQVPIHRGAIAYGHSFTVTEKNVRTGKVITRGLSALTTAAIYRDPANDIVPVAALTVTSRPKGDERGAAIMWDHVNEYDVTFKDYHDPTTIRVKVRRRHGSSECPVTRFAAQIDLEGRTIGIIKQMIPYQDRFNQTIFDLLVTQTYSSNKVRFGTGVTPPVKRDEDGNPILDENGNPTPVRMNHNARRFLFAPDPQAKYGTLDETPLNGFIEAAEMTIRQMSAAAGIPPHYLLGQIANLSADALRAAETAMRRKVQEYRNSFGESWERVFRLAAELSGVDVAAEDYSGEVIWRDDEHSLAQSADALGKLGDQLGIPKRGLWDRVPGVTRQELKKWDELKAQEPDEVLSTRLSRASAGSVLTSTRGGSLNDNEAAFA